MVEEVTLTASKRQLNPYLLSSRSSLTGLGAFIREVGRNPILHANAKNISITIREQSFRKDLFLEILDDGIGMDADGRWRAGCAFGWSKFGNGTGFRESGVSIARLLEMHTVQLDDPEVAWRISIPLHQFFLEIQENRWRKEWEKIPRAESRIPENYASGSLIILSDFRAQDPHAPHDQERLRSTRAQITEANVRSHIEKGFPPDLARLFIVNGKRVQPRSIEGFLLWHEASSAKPGIGIVSGEVRLSDTGSGNWLVIGGTTATISFQSFMEQFQEENPELARQIPAVFTRERRLTGLIRIEILEKYPTRDRMKLLPTFHTSPEAIMVKNELVRIGDKLIEGLRKYESLPRPDRTESVIAQFVANMHIAQGARPGTGMGGEREGTSGPSDAPVDQIEALRVNQTTVHLEPWTGTGVRDAVTVQVQNPLPDEVFDWEDQGGVLGEARNTHAILQGVKREGTYLVRVHSRLHAKRDRTIQVLVRLQDAVRPSGDQFCLAPLGTQVVVRQMRVIRIRQQGPTSGKGYEWRVEPMTEGSRKKIADLVVQTGEREAHFTGYKPGVYTVACIDKKNSSLVAHCRLEVLASRQDIEQPPSPPPPGGSGTDSGTELVNGGTGNPDSLRPSPHTGQLLDFLFRDRWHRFSIRSDASFKDPIAIYPEDHRILISDACTPHDDPILRLQHIAFCIAHGIMLMLMDEGVLSPSDSSACSELLGRILAMGFREKKTAE